MKQFSLLTFLLVTLMIAHAQNVGIGTSTPVSPLTVIANSSGKGIIQKSGDVEIGFFSDISAYIQTWSNHPLYFATNNKSGQMVLSTIGNLGIGAFFNSQPEQKLHVLGNAAIMGKVGIETTAPTSALDVNGLFRLRGGNPSPGAVLTSIDGNGNAIWKNDRIAFRSSGLVNGDNVEIPANNWTKVIFNSSPSYNLGIGYQPLASQFQATAGGVYHFDAQFTYFSNQYTYDSRVRLVLNRNGNLSTLVERRRHSGSDVDERNVYFPAHIELGTDVLLLAGDIVWLELYVPIFLKNEDGSSRTSLSLSGDARLTWFTGHLVASN